MQIYVVLIHNYREEYVTLEKAFTTYEAALAYRNELAGENNMNDHFYQVESVKL